MATRLMLTLYRTLAINFTVPFYVVTVVFPGFPAEPLIFM